MGLSLHGFYSMGSMFAYRLFRKHSLLIFLSAVTCVLSLFIQTRALALSCEDLLTDQLIGKPGEAWQTPNLAISRIQAALQHQNQIRQQAMQGISKVRENEPLPLLELMFQRSDYSARLRTSESGPIQYWIEQGYPDPSTGGYFWIDGDLMIRASYNDFWGFNYVYRFQNSALVEIATLALWKLRQMPQDEVVFYRSCSKEEINRWEQGDFENLGNSRWGYGEADGLVHPALHFATSPWNGHYNIKIHVSKKDLIEFARQSPSHLWAASLDEQSARFSSIENFEFIFTRHLLKELKKRNALRVEYSAESN